MHKVTSNIWQAKKKKKIVRTGYFFSSINVFLHYISLTRISFHVTYISLISFQILSYKGMLWNIGFISKNKKGFKEMDIFFSGQTFFSYLINKHFSLWEWGGIDFFLMLDRTIFSFLLIQKVLRKLQPPNFAGNSRCNVCFALQELKFHQPAVNCLWLLFSNSVSCKIIERIQDLKMSEYDPKASISCIGISFYLKKKNIL